MGPLLWLRRGKKNSFPISLWKNTYRLLFPIIWTVKASNESHTTDLWLLLSQESICLLRYVFSSTEYGKDNKRLLRSGAQACVQTSPPYGFLWPMVHWRSAPLFYRWEKMWIHGIHSELLIGLLRSSTLICRKLYIFLKEPLPPPYENIFL